MVTRNKQKQTEIERITMSHHLICDQCECRIFITLALSLQCILNGISCVWNRVCFHLVLVSYSLHAISKLRIQAEFKKRGT